MKKIKILKNILISSLLISCTTIKNTPEGVNYESPLRESKKVRFHYDLSYLDKNGNVKYDRNIWEATYEILDNAKDYLIIEMFLFNDIYNKDIENFPAFAKEYISKLVKKKKENPELKIYVLSDENNNLYGAFEHLFMKELKEAGIEVIEVDIMKLKDTFPWYSPLWRTFIKPFGNPQNKGWIENFYGPMWPKVSVRNILRALNVKADHKKVFLNEKEVMVSSANIHDPSYYHGNIALYSEGEIVEDVLDNLKKVAKFSNGNITVENNGKNEKGLELENFQYKIQYLTEGKIGEYLDLDLDNLGLGDEILMGMYFLADKKVIEKLIEASNRGAKVKLILDRSKDAFGMSTNGFPNKPVSKKLKRKTENKIEVKWYFTNNEQYHTKLILIGKSNGDVIIHGGSANIIKKNIRGYIMDSNFRVLTNKNSELFNQIYSYFDRLWGNKDGIFTLEYNDEPTTTKKADIMFEILDMTQLGSF